MGSSPPRPPPPEEQNTEGERVLTGEKKSPLVSLSGALNRLPCTTTARDEEKRFPLLRGH